MDTATSPSLTEEFREVMAGVCTPVSVVTTIEGTRPHGTTVSAFASLSMTPPMVLVALDRGSELLALLGATGRFGVNVLGSAQADLAVRFAGKGKAKFDGVPWTLAHGVPRLSRVPGWLACTVDKFVEGGDHVIALGLVVAAERRAGPPLTYHARSFGTHTTAGGKSA
ncbi:flavin reductase family protein [Prauserella oleivorans]|uniref:Flavin reductase family protein n=1 Tax=Prauserella oleivorans TaxID=1478153 RepID=A0ABW5WFB4_9PSEU